MHRLAMLIASGAKAAAAVLVLLAVVAIAVRVALGIAERETLCSRRGDADELR